MNRVTRRKVKKSGEWCESAAVQDARARVSLERPRLNGVVFYLSILSFDRDAIALE